MATSSPSDDEKPVIQLDRTTSPPIGVGSFATVYKAKYGDKEVAVKILNLHMTRHSPKFEKYRDIETNELVPSLKSLRHPNVVSILGWEDKFFPELWIVLELCDSGLDVYLEKNDISAPDTLDLVCQCAQGLAYLHANNVVHRDVKPNNYLIVVADSKPIAKITDFSLCKDVDSLPGSTMTTVRGNKNWLAPELLTSNGHVAPTAHYKRAVDVFSFALVVIYICVNKTGRDKLETTCLGYIAKSGDDMMRMFMGCWRHMQLSSSMLWILDNMLHLNPQSRQSMDKITASLTSLKPILDGCGMQLESLASHSLGNKSPGLIGITLDGSVMLLYNIKCSTPMQQQLQLNADSYNHVHSCQRPFSGIVSFCRRYASGKHIVVQHPQSNKTHLYDENLEHHSTTYRDKGPCLVGVFSTNATVYRESYIVPDHSKEKQCRTHRHYYSLLVYDGNTPMKTLKSRPDSRWGPGLSVCRNRLSRWIAVSEHWSQSLVIYDDKVDSADYRNECIGKDHVNLGFKPASVNGIACSAEFLFIIEYRSTLIHVYNWSGEKITVFDVKEKVALKKSEKVFSVGVSLGDVLQVVMKGNNVSSIHAFKLSA